MPISQIQSRHVDIMGRRSYTRITPVAPRAAPKIRTLTRGRSTTVERSKSNDAADAPRAVQPRDAPTRVDAHHRTERSRSVQTREHAEAAPAMRPSAREDSRTLSTEHAQDLVADVEHELVRNGRAALQAQANQ